MGKQHAQEMSDPALEGAVRASGEKPGKAGHADAAAAAATMLKDDHALNKAAPKGRS